MNEMNGARRALAAAGIEGADADTSLATIDQRCAGITSGFAALAGELRSLIIGLTTQEAYRRLTSIVGTDAARAAAVLCAAGPDRIRQLDIPEEQ